MKTALECPSHALRCEELAANATTRDSRTALIADHWCRLAVLAEAAEKRTPPTSAPAIKSVRAEP